MKKLLFTIFCAGLCLLSCNKAEENPLQQHRPIEWRGVMIDVSRHYYPIEVLERQIDLMGRYGLNVLHLHLTDAAGWRLEIKKYPRLTDVGAWRTHQTWKEWWAVRPRPTAETKGNEWFTPAFSDSKNGFGGFYSQEEMRALVAYAAERGVTIVPEIEFPAHSEETVAAYPWLGYNHSELDMSKDSTYMFMADVLAEVADIFPAEYIHVGGDESSTQKGKQPEAMRRIQKIVEDLGKRMIVWDEGLTDNPADSNQVIMVWRNPDTATEAIRLGHDVILCPSNWCYLDSYQDEPMSQPEAMGGYRPLSHIYEVPLDSALCAEAQSTGSLLGVQACIFTEYVPTPEILENQLWPRALAIAERGLANKRSYEEFHKWAINVTDSMRQVGIKAFDLANEYGQRKESLQPVEHMALGAKVTYNNPYNNYYKAGGDSTLTDGVCGTWNNNDQRWQGFIRNIDLQVDLGQEKEVSNVSLSFLQILGPEIYLPAEVQMTFLAEDNTQLMESSVQTPADQFEAPFVVYPYQVELAEPVKARYISIKCPRTPRMGWLFLDEIVVK